MTEATAKKLEAGPPTSVLIVEDEWMVAWDLERSLKEMGYQVIATVDSSHEALRVAAERRPDVALMDIRINGDADGIATASALSERFDVPVVYLTAYTDDATLSRAARSQAYGYVVKPFTSREVRSAIEVARHKHAADAQVAKRERWLSTTLRSLGDAVVACDPEHKVALMNPAAEALTGWKEAEARGRPVDEVVQIRSAAGPRRPLQDALEARARQTLPPGTLLVPREGGEPAEIDDSAAPIELGGAVLGAVLCFRDVTEQRQLQRQAEATERLASLGLMATGVGYEINNPLAFVHSSMGVLAAGLDRVDAAIHDGHLGPELASQVEDMVEVVDDVRMGAERIRKVVSDLDVFGRPASNQRAPVDVREVLRWALRATGNQVRVRGRLTSDLQAAPRVLASEVWLGQVFITLLTNAAQALPPGAEESNEVHVCCGPAPDGRVFVSVSDTGSGLGPDLASGSPGAGPGLGLLVGHTAITAMGGELRVRRSPGRGTIFEVLLPAAGDEADPEPGAGPGATARRRRVLVVDDEVLVGRAIKRVLSRKHEVTAIHDPNEALRLLERGEAFDLILCDVMMPGLSGAELYERLNARSPSTAERMVFLTGGAFTSAARQFLDSIPNRRLEKPFDAVALEALVDAILSG
ncbi:MAG TPA: response regulator [Myxococcaceae bacterium]|nr:response regulator [Myxococcaceae bacterium]